MCGVAGIHDPELSGSELLVAAADMAELLRHRGPDGGGSWLHGATALGHRRLAIIDVEGGAQPMVSPDGRFALCYNGEVFNYLELREELKAHWRFRTRTDTEVVLAAYATWGEDCLSRFNGEFAFALVDLHRRQIFLARDRFGIKPLYYLHDGERLLFASEVKALLTQVQAQPDAQVIREDYQTFQCTWGDRTIFSGIEGVPPAHFGRFDLRSKALSLHRYWEIQPNAYDEGRSFDEHVEELRALLADSVRLRLRSDMPVGSYLSGGMDSSAITCLARPQHVVCTHFASELFGDAYDESRFQREVAAAAGSQIHWVRPDAQRFPDLCRQITWHMDQPGATMAQYPQFLMAQEASRHVKVMLGGQGSDELWGGYIRYLIVHLEQQLAGAMFRGQPFDPTGLEQFRLYEPLVRKAWSKGMFEQLELRYFRIVNRGYPGAISQMQRFMRHFEAFEHYINKMLYTDLMTSLVPLLQVEDRINSAASIEARLPMLDHRLVELAFRVPPERKLHRNITKALLREALKGTVPESVRARPDKVGFPVPMNQWLTGELRGWTTELLRSHKRRGLPTPELDYRGKPGGEFNRNLFASVSLELWFQVFIDGAAERTRPRTELAKARALRVRPPHPHKSPRPGLAAAS